MIIILIHRVIVGNNQILRMTVRCHGRMAVRCLIFFSFSMLLYHVQRETCSLLSHKTKKKKTYFFQHTLFLLFGNKERQTGWRSQLEFSKGNGLKKRKRVEKRKSFVQFFCMYALMKWHVIKHVNNIDNNLHYRV